MKSHPVYILLGLALSFVLTGCEETSKELFHVDLLVTGPLTTDGKTADGHDVRLLWRAFESEGSCSSVFLPIGTAFRIDQAVPSAVVLKEPNGLKVQVQELGTGQTVEMIHSNRLEQLEELDLSPLIAGTVLSDSMTMAAVRTWLNKKQGYDTLLAVGAKIVSPGAWKGITIYDSIDSLSVALERIACSKNDCRTAVLFLPPNQGGQKDYSQLGSGPSSEALLDTMRSINAVLSETGNDTLRAHAIAGAALRSYSSSILAQKENYEVIYELMKTVIYDGDHHEAFPILAKAAEVALMNNKGDQLMAMIEADLARDKRTVWRMSTTDHRQDWSPIIEALTRKNIALVTNYKFIGHPAKTSELSEPDHESVVPHVPNTTGLRLKVAEVPKFILPKSCGGKAEFVILRVTNAAGELIPNCAVTLGKEAVSWVVSPPLTREVTGAMSVHTGSDGTVALSVRRPDAFEYKRTIKLEFAVNSDRASSASLAKATIDICPTCEPCI